MEIQIDESAKNRLNNFKIGYAVISNVAVEPNKKGLDKEVFEAISKARIQYSDISKISESRIIKDMKILYDQTKIDSTRYRHSAEALIRCVIRDGRIHRINTVVDINNVGSILYALPMGVYNLDNLKGNVVFRFGKIDETMPTMAKGEKMNIENFLVSCDDEKIFGSVISDSPTAMIHAGKTKNILFILYAPPSVTESYVREALDFVIEKMIQYNGGVLGESGIKVF